jgi:type IV fimbrial biogenesis protein FimT
VLTNRPLQDLIALNAKVVARLQAGFTLIEALVVLSITAIVLAWGMPQLADFTSTRATAAQVTALAGAMRLARSEAVKRSTRVTVCPSLTAEAAVPACDGGAGDWAQGWIVFADLGALNVIDNGDRIIQVQPPFTKTGGIVSTSPSGAVAVNFFPTGVTMGGQRNFEFRVLSSATGAALDGLAKRMCMDNTGATRSIKFSEAC